MIIKYQNGDELHFPNIRETTNIEAPLVEPQPKSQWVRDAKGNWIRS